MYGGNPVSIPFRVVISHCMLHTLTLSGNPADLLLSKSAIAGENMYYILALTYGQLFISSDPPNCPLIRYELQGTNGAVLIHPQVTLTFPNTASDTRLLILYDASYTVTIRVHAWTEEKDNYFSWNIRVCGEEALSLVSPPIKFFIFAL